VENSRRVVEDLMRSMYSDGSNHSSCADHIFEKVNPEMAKLGYECKCLGGGKIDHNSKDKKIRVFGLSTVSVSLVFLPIPSSLAFWVFCFYSTVAFGNLNHSVNTHGKLAWLTCETV